MKLATKISSAGSPVSSSTPTTGPSLFRRAGAQFVVPVAEHHDGLAMYDAAYSDWNTVKVGPHRDVVGRTGECRPS